MMSSSAVQSEARPPSSVPISTKASSPARGHSTEWYPNVDQLRLVANLVSFGLAWSNSVVWTSGLGAAGSVVSIRTGCAPAETTRPGRTSVRSWT